MTPNEITFWKVVCGLLVIACIRVHSIGFLATSVLVYYSLLSVPRGDYTDVSRDYSSDDLVSARTAQIEEEIPIPAQPDKVPNWRKVQSSGSSSSTTFRTTPAGQPTNEQRNRLMQSLYAEMKMS